MYLSVVKTNTRMTIEQFHKAHDLDRRMNQLRRVKMFLESGLDVATYSQAVELLGETDQLEEIRKDLIAKLEEAHNEAIKQFESI